VAGEERTERGFDRLVNFSDAVVAIAISLLILPVVDDVSAGNESAADLLDRHGGQLLAFAISFAVIARFWVVHHQMFERVVGYTPAILLANIAWLATIVFLPLPTELLGDGTSDERLRFGLYIASVFLVSLTLVVVNLAMVRAPEIHRPGVAPPSTHGGIVATGLIVVAFVVAVTVPAIGMFSMFVMVLAGPVERLVFRRDATT